MFKSINRSRYFHRDAFTMIEFVLSLSFSFNIDNRNGEQCFTATEGTRQVTLNGQQVAQRTITISDGPDKTKPVCAIALQVADQKGLHTKGMIETIVFAGTRSSF